MTDIYKILHDGRIVELQLGHLSNCNDAIWARNLNAQEKRTYLKLKDMGYSDTNIYNYFKLEDKHKSYAGS